MKPILLRVCSRIIRGYRLPSIPTCNHERKLSKIRPISHNTVTLTPPESLEERLSSTNTPASMRIAVSVVPPYHPVLPFHNLPSPLSISRHLNPSAPASYISPSSPSPSSHPQPHPPPHHPTRPAPPPCRPSSSKSDPSQSDHH